MPNTHFKSQIIIQNVNFLTLQEFCLSNSLPAIRPGSTMARATVFLHDKGNRVRFTKLLFQRNFIHSA